MAPAVQKRLTNLIQRNMQANKKPKPSPVAIWLPLMLSIALAAGIYIGMRLSGPATPDDASPNHKIEALIRYIEAKYVDEVDRHKLVDEAITAVLRQLDPHSSYISPEELSKIKEQMAGEFMGIGVEFLLLGDTVVVVSVAGDSPAKKAGILAGDKIIAVEDSLVSGKGLNSDDIIRRLRDENKSKVRIAILRYPGKSPKTLTLERRRIPIKSVDAAYWLNDRVAYIRINRFSATTDKEFLAALERLSARNRQIHLILDLRHNPGGYLQQASNILSQIFPERGVLMVYTEGRTVHRSDYHSSGRAFFDIGKIAVLIDEGSASASEIIAGAVQDHDRGLVIGRRSYGKGLVQEQYALGDGSAVRLTVARYFTPSGRSIQRPYKKNGQVITKTTGPAEVSGPAVAAGTGNGPDSTVYFTDAGRVVYSGGGILPDITIPADSIGQLPIMQEVRNKLPVFSLSSYGEAKKRFEGERTLYFRQYTIGDSTVAAFKQYLTSTAPGFSPLEWQAVKSRLPYLIKAHVARNLFGPEAYFQVINQHDPTVQKALQHLFTPKKKPFRAGGLTPG